MGGASGALTDAAILKAKPAAKARKLFDERGLFLLVAPTGGKLWRLKYRLSGKEKLLALGSYPDVSLADARDRRDAARKLIAAGTDPAEQRRAEKETAGATFEQIAREWFEKQREAWADSHAETVITRLEQHVFPRCGIPKEEMSGHGFRATARTILDEVLHFRVDLIEHQLGHAVKDANGRAYNRTAFLAERSARTHPEMSRSQIPIRLEPFDHLLAHRGGSFSEAHCTRSTDGRLA